MTCNVHSQKLSFVLAQLLYGKPTTHNRLTSFCITVQVVLCELKAAKAYASDDANH